MPLPTTTPKCGRDFSICATRSLQILDDGLRRHASRAFLAHTVPPRRAWKPGAPLTAAGRGHSATGLRNGQSTLLGGAGTGTIVARPGGETGSHKGLKTPRRFTPPCRFESGPGHSERPHFPAVTTVRDPN